MVDNLLDCLNRDFKGSYDNDDDMHVALDALPRRFSDFDYEACQALDLLEEVCDTLLEDARVSENIARGNAMARRIAAFYRGGFEDTNLPLLARKRFGTKAIAANLLCTKLGAELGNTRAVSCAYIAAGSIAEDLAGIAEKEAEEDPDLHTIYLKIQINRLEEAYQIVVDQIKCEEDESRKSYAQHIGAEIARNLAGLARSHSERLKWTNEWVVREKASFEAASLRKRGEEFKYVGLSKSLGKLAQLQEGAEQIATYKEAATVCLEAANWDRSRAGGNPVIGLNRAARSYVFLSIVDPENAPTYLEKARDCMSQADDELCHTEKIPAKLTQTRIWLSLLTREWKTAGHSIHELQQHPDTEGWREEQEWYQNFLRVASNGTDREAVEALYQDSEVPVDGRIYGALKKQLLDRAA